MRVGQRQEVGCPEPVNPAGGEMWDGGNPFNANVRQDITHHEAARMQKPPSFFQLLLLRRALVVSLASAGVVACTDSESPAVPFEAVPLTDETAIRPAQRSTPSVANIPTGGAQRAVVDGRTSGDPSFYFLFPIVLDRAPRDGAFDPEARPSVTICRVAAGACAETVAEFPYADGSGHPLRSTRQRTSFEFYIATWLTPRAGAGLYRATVQAFGIELGYADIQLVRRLQDLRAVPDDVVGVLAGWPLPIPFRIEKVLGARVGPAGGTVEFADGQVRLDVPPGALLEDVFITAVPADGLPPAGPPVAPGMAWDFGPDGLVFEQPVLMTIAYDPANLPPGSNEGELRIHQLVDGTFVQLDAGRLDVVNNTASALVGGFSVFAAMERMFAGSLADGVPPVPLSVQVLDPATDTFGSEVTIDVSAGDVTLTHRVSLTDNISGAARALIIYISPRGLQSRISCSVIGDPATGVDTNGTWECQSVWARYSEAGTWTPVSFFLDDKVGNTAFFGIRQDGEICTGGPDPNCLADILPVITLVSDPSDTQPPMLSSLEVSLDVQPRIFGSSVSVDAVSMPQPIVFRFEATDNLAGVGLSQPPPPFFPQFGDIFSLTLRGPSGFVTTEICTLVAGNTLAGSWECPLTIPQFAAVGTWTVRELWVPDRAGNGNRPSSLGAVWLPDGTGQLCRIGWEGEGGPNCVNAPTVEVQ